LCVSRAASAALFVCLNVRTEHDGAKEVKLHAKSSSGVRWQRPADALQVGDTFRVTAGYDKQFGTCRKKFANDFMLRVVSQRDKNDGKRLR